MKLVKIKISSASTAFRPRPEFNDEVEQRVTIHASGRVRVQRILFGDETVDNVVASNEEFRIPQGDAEEILETCAGYFQYWETPEITTDIGGWKLTMTDDEGQKYRAAGPLEGEYKLGDKDLNQLSVKSWNAATVSGSSMEGLARRAGRKDTSSSWLNSSRAASATII